MENLSTYIQGVLVFFLVSSFAKVFTTLTILRFGIGLGRSGFGLIIFVFSFALSLLVMNPQLEKMGGFESFIRGAGSLEAQGVQQNFRPFLEKHADVKTRERLKKVNEKLRGASSTNDPTTNAAGGAEEPFSLLVSSFLISELTLAFQLGVLFLVPFVLIDILITNVLALLGITQLTSEALSLPLKLLLFFVVDGWTLVTEKLLVGYTS